MVTGDKAAVRGSWRFAGRQLDLDRRELFVGGEPSPVEPKVFDLIAYLLASAMLTLASRHDPVALAVFVALIAATVAVAWRTEAAAGAVPAAAMLAVLVVVRWALNLDLEHLVAPSGPVAGAVPRAKSAGARIVIVNAEPTAFDEAADVVFRERIGDVLPALLTGDQEDPEST